MSLIRYEPFGLFEPFFSGKTGGALDAFANHWRPAVDIREEDERFVISADLPGVEPQDIEVTAEDGMLTLKGERNIETQDEQDGYRKVERRRGAFQRCFSLPEGVSPEQIVANGKNGVLEIVIPKQEKTQPTRIAVNH